MSILIKNFWLNKTLWLNKLEINRYERERSAVQNSDTKIRDDFERHCVSVPSATRPGRPVGPGAGCCWNQRGGVPSTSLRLEPYAFSRLSALTATRAGWDSVNWVSTSPKTRLDASGAGLSVALNRWNSSNNSNINERRGRRRGVLQFSNYVTYLTTREINRVESDKIS